MTPVIFRKWKDNGDIIALFPYEMGTNDPWSCLSYERIGQHGSACTRHITTVTTLAKPEDYKSLYKELVSMNYLDMTVMKALTRKAFDHRCKELIKPAPQHKRNQIS